MITGDTPESPSPPHLDRASVFAGGPQKISRRAILYMLVAAASLAVLGVIGEHLFSSAGLNPTAGTTTTQPLSTNTSLPFGAPQLTAPLRAFMGLATLKPAPAVGFTLESSSRRTLSLAGEHGKVVVLSFFNGDCKDICPVIEAEIAKADEDLGAEAGRVAFLTVNTDPLVPQVGRTAAAVMAAPVAHLRNWYLLGGTLARLNRVWRAYGIQIDVVRSLKVVAHNEAIFFIDPDGRVRYQAVPYANESSGGVFSLSASEIARWGSGIAHYVRVLLEERS